MYAARELPLPYGMFYLPCVGRDDPARLVLAKSTPLGTPRRGHPSLRFLARPLPNKAFGFAGGPIFGGASPLSQGGLGAGGQRPPLRRVSFAIPVRAAL